MLEGVRRQLARRREESEKAKLKDIEVQRRLSYIKTKRLQSRKGAEEELRAQKGAEITTLAEAREALAERKRAEKELRRMTPGLGRRVATTTKRAFYDVPVKTIKAFSQPGTSKRLQKMVMGDPEVLFGRRKPVEKTPERKKAEQSASDFVFGKSHEGKDIFS